MLVQGSASVVQALAPADLVDEYRLFVHRGLLGAGTPLFTGGHGRQDLDVVLTVQYASGVVATTYQRREAPDDRPATQRGDQVRRPHLRASVAGMAGRHAARGRRGGRDGRCGDRRPRRPDVAGVTLESTATATSIHGGVITDGPFVETKEGLAGLYVLEARDLDHAIELARLTPIADGSVEVRPLIDFQIVEQP